MGHLLYRRHPKATFFILLLSIHSRDKSLKRGKAFGGACVHARVLKDALEGLSDLGLKNVFHVLCGKGVVITETFEPCFVLFNALVG